MKKLKSLIVNGAMLAGVLGLLFVGLFLQECSSDGVPEAAKRAGLELPLAVKDLWIDVNLDQMVLELKSDEIIIRRYDIGYGPGPMGALRKEQAGTPIGEFRVLKKQKRKDIWNRGSRFILLNHPLPELAESAWDNDVISDEEYFRIRDAHEAAPEEGPPPAPPFDTPLGGPLGIQGGFSFITQRRFTDGSIALSNGEMNELFEYVTPGMRVVIRER